MNEGWQCPQCGKVLAPWREECNHVLRISTTVVLPAGPAEPEPLHPWDTGNDPQKANTWTDSATWKPDNRIIGSM